ncbi:MAG: GTPase Era [Peptostreptococcaceae bacterium]|nr:GTPase Era [Peptostreptococcaceae bacterium]
MAVKKFKSGFVTIIGRPNVGKSTLVNALVGEKVAIISNKPQTTRNRISAVYTDNEKQIVFIDTPGIHKPKNKLGEFMVHEAKTTFNEVDLIVFMVDESKSIGPGDNHIIESLKEVRTPCLLVVNKLDLITPQEFKEIYEKYEAMGIFDEIIGISAQNQMNLKKLISTIGSYMEEGPKYFPEDMVTDQPERFIVSEIIREKLLNILYDEVPHGIAVGIEKMKKREDSEITDIYAIIYCEKKSHKGIIIGKNGKVLKKVGIDARKDIENLLGNKVFLEIWVKIKEEWRDRDSLLNQFGYR